jgi:hypothetical protein
MSGLRLNLGCGQKRFDGYINVDRFGEPDLRHDLESVPWPWSDDSVSEIIMEHVLEHLGRDATVYLDIWKEIYRVCQDGATIRIAVPHHRHEFFYNDPTHVRAVTAEGMNLFSQRLNRKGAAKGLSNTPLGLYLGIDFEPVDVKLKPSDSWLALHAQNPAAAKFLWQQNALYNNIIEQVDIVLRAVKPPGREAG